MAWTHKVYNIYNNVAKNSLAINVLMQINLHLNWAQTKYIPLALITVWMNDLFTLCDINYIGVKPRRWLQIPITLSIKCTACNKRKITLCCLTVNCTNAILFGYFHIRNAQPSPQLHGILYISVNLWTCRRFSIWVLNVSFDQFKAENFHLIICFI